MTFYRDILKSSTQTDINKIKIGGNMLQYNFAPNLIQERLFMICYEEATATRVQSIRILPGI